MTYFTNCNTLEELKKEYRRLAMVHHPDLGGDPETMKSINNAYDQQFQILKDRHNAQAAKSPNARPIHETPEQFREILAKLLHLHGLKIELCGSWVWVSGNTYPHRHTMSELGLRWSKSKKMWYWRNEADAAPFTRKPQSMADIRRKYGSEIVGSGSTEGLPA